MSVQANRQLISGLIDEVWNQHDAAAIGRYFGPGLREEVAEHQRQLLTGFPDLRVTVEDGLIADGELVVARLTLTGTHRGVFAGRAATGRVVSWSSIRIYRVAGARSSRPGPCRTASACCSRSAPSVRRSRSTGPAADGPRDPAPGRAQRVGGRA